VRALREALRRREDVPRREPAEVSPTVARGLRPNVVWFGETLEPAHLGRVEQFIAQARDLVFFAVGTSGAVWPRPVSSTPCAESGARPGWSTCSPAKTTAARFDVVLTGKSGEVLRRCGEAVERSLDGDERVVPALWRRARPATCAAARRPRADERPGPLRHERSNRYMVRAARRGRVGAVYMAVHTRTTRRWR